MPDAEHVWTPNLAPKQLEIFNCGTEEDNYKRFILVDGGRLCGKSIAVGHRVFRHLWETPGARVGLVAKTYKNAKRGAWADLIEIVAPEWLSSGMVGSTQQPLEYTSNSGSGPGPAHDSLTRTPYFRIRNYWGGESELVLYSLDNDDDVEAKLRSTRFSMLWFSELQNFQNRKVFNDSILNLRIPSIPVKKRMWIADANPPEDGKDSWQYKLWYEEINETDTVLLNKDTKEFRQDLRLIHVRLEDNPFLEQGEIATLKGTYANDPAEYDRNVNGLYVKGHGTLDKHFAELIIPDIHYIEPAIEVDPSTDTLITGWDIGAKNNAFCILEKRVIDDLSFWMLLDEYVTIGEEITTAAFAVECYNKMMRIEEYYRRHFEWKHWSDDSALLHFRGGTGGMDAAEVLKATNGKIVLEAAVKGRDSVRDGVAIIRRLLRNKRFFIGNNCPKAQESLEGLKVSQEPNKIVDNGPLKHPFDSWRYPIYMEERDFLVKSALPQASQRIGVIHA